LFTICLATFKIHEIIYLYMDNTKKALKIFAALAVVFTLSSFGTLLNNTQKAQVSSVSLSGAFSVFNKNETVKEAQIILKNLGFYDGKTSGLFGFKTRNALFNYQTSVQIPRTGILDIITQEKLFAPPPAEYTLVENTKYGNDFLYEWLFYTHGYSPGEMIELEGLLINEKEDIKLNEYLYTAKHTLTNDSTKYGVFNISEINLDEYLDLNVRVSGYVFENILSTNKPVIFINHVSENEDQEEYPLLGYTLDGNNELKYFVEGKYNQTGQYISISGNIDLLSEYMIYSEASNPTNVVLLGLSEKYAIENISGASFEALNGASTTVRGFLLDGLNEKGYPTIVVNYIE